MILKKIKSFFKPNILSIFHKNEKKLLFYILLVVLIGSLLEILTITTLVPFVKILADPSIKTLEDLKIDFISKLPIKNYDINVNIFFISTLFFMIFGILFRTFIGMMNTFFINYCERKLSTRLFNLNLNLNYETFLGRKKNDMGRQILADIMHALQITITPLINVSQNILTIFFIFLGLYIIEPNTTIILFISFLLIAILYLMLFKNFIKKLGETRHLSNVKRFKFANDALNQFKYIKINKNKDFWVKIFEQNMKSFGKSQVQHNLFLISPKSTLEIIILISFAIFFLFSKSYEFSFLDNSHILAGFFYGAYRLAPALSVVISSFTNINFSKKVVDDLKSKFFEDFNNQNTSLSVKKTIHKENLLELENVSFKYQNSKFNSLSNISFSLKKSSIFGLFGRSGSGKSTLIDIILGLLSSFKGELRINQEITLNINDKEQTPIGYISRNNILFPGTVKDNLLMGMSSNKPSNQDIFSQIMSITGLDDVLSTLDNGLDSFIGDDANNISSGQAQRLCIARELLKHPKLLIIDEGTSSLDISSEISILKKIKNLFKDITIIIVSHRKDSLKICDQVLELH